VTYLSEVIADNPKHYWRCADPAPGLFNDIGSTPVALVTNITQACFPFSGPNSDGGSFYCDSNNDAVFRDTESNGTPLSVECWFWQHYIRGVTQALFDVEQASVTSLALAFITSTGAVQVNAGAGHLTTASFPPVQRWHHLVVTRSASLTSIYLDGASIGSFATAAQAAVPVQFAVGAAVGDTSVASANISEVAYYTTVLSAARVLAHFNAADQTSQPPIAGSGSLSGASTNLFYTGLLEQILQSVRKLY